MQIQKIGKSVKITSADFYHRLFIEKAFYLLRKALFLFIKFINGLIQNIKNGCAYE